MQRDVVARPSARPRKVASGGARPSRTEAETVWLHASCVQLGGTGVVLLGASGIGKSDLALRLIDAGGSLVADDRLQVEADATGLLGRPAATLAGLLEVRGVGILRLPHCEVSRLGLVVELDRAEAVARLPERLTYTLLGADLRCLRLDPREPSAVAKVRLALTTDRVA